jgi:putative hemolysin
MISKSEIERAIVYGHSVQFTMSSLPDDEAKKCWAVLLQIAELHLAAMNSGMPKKIPVDKLVGHANAEARHCAEHGNAIIDACTAHIVAKLAGIEAVIEEARWRQAQDMMMGKGKHHDYIAHAIRENFLGEDK